MKKGNLRSCFTTQSDFIIQLKNRKIPFAQNTFNSYTVVINMRRSDIP